jgi:hypothetical protein
MIVLAAIVVRSLLRRQWEVIKLPVIAWLAPLWLHAFFFAWLFIGGFYTENNWMVITASINLLIGVSIHLLVFPRRRRAVDNTYSLAEPGGSNCKTII